MKIRNRNGNSNRNSKKNRVVKNSERHFAPFFTRKIQAHISIHTYMQPYIFTCTLHMTIRQRKCMCETFSLYNYKSNKCMGRGKLWDCVCVRKTANNACKYAMKSCTRAVACQKKVCCAVCGMRHAELKEDIWMLAGWLAAMQQRITERSAKKPTPV